MERSHNASSMSLSSPRLPLLFSVSLALYIILPFPTLSHISVLSFSFSLPPNLTHLASHPLPCSSLSLSRLFHARDFSSHSSAQHFTLALFKPFVVIWSPASAHTHTHGSRYARARARVCLCMCVYVYIHTYMCKCECIYMSLGIIPSNSVFVSVCLSVLHIIYPSVIFSMLSSHLSFSLIFLLVNPFFSSRHLSFHLSLL